MQLFHGLSKTDYQDVLRALGLYLDEHNLCNVRIIEHEEGIIIQATPRVDGHATHEYQSLLLTDADLEQMIRYAYNRRAKRVGAEAVEPPTGRPLLAGRKAGAAR